MRRKAFASVVILFLFTLHANAGSTHTTDEISAIYQQASAFYTLAHPTETTDAKALDLFTTVISDLESSHRLEEMLFQSYLKKGVLLDVKGFSDKALMAYSGAIRCLNRHPEWGDSLYFNIYIYAGPDYYKLGYFDSAYAVLSKAEALTHKYAGFKELDRLYNALGALYYESGNYLQATDEFSRSLEIVRRERPYDKISQVNFENNLASCLYKLGEYKESLEMYRQLLGFGQSSSQLYLNMGKSYIGLNQFAEGLALFRKVSPKEVPAVYNEMAYAEFLLGRKDSALSYLNKWSQGVDPALQNRIDAGTNDLYRAQVLMSSDQELAAVDFLQRAIITFSGNFSSTDVHTNPQAFIGSFANYRLFDALSYKALVLELLYTHKGNATYLEESLNAYRSALKLFRYIENTYTTDDAKLFLKKNNRDLYQNAFLTCVEMDRLHPKGPYMEEAFSIAEKSKASILTGGLEDLSYQKMPGTDPQLLAKQREIKYNIARLELQSDPDQGKNATQDIANRKADYEIALSSIQKSMEENSAYYQIKFGDSCPRIKDLQSGLTSHQAIISLFVSTLGLHAFLITEHGFHYLYLDSLPKLQEEVSNWISLLSNTDKGHRFGNPYLENALYHRLVQPIQNLLPGINEWIVIPDNVFSQLPFESLPAGSKNHYLLETTTISYQLSAKFMAPPYLHAGQPFQQYAVLSMAPFSLRGFWDNDIFMPPLPGSLAETNGLPGQQFTNARATKETFLNQVNRYPVIHLATHAVGDPNAGMGSRICFYPTQKDPGENNLYLPELYALKLDSTDLVILSACESGKGELVDNEGMMSLSRGFLYAGCASTVNSLWAADDGASAFILHRLHAYLEKGLPKAQALRLAKLDYIHSDAVYTTPNYWANFILMGNTDPIIVYRNPVKYVYLTGLAILIGAVIIVAIFIWRAKSINPSRSSS